MNWIRKDNSKEVDKCFGTDPNRNWNYLWNEKGSSRSTCSDFYAGPRAFSEPETKAVSKFLMENKKHFKVSDLSDNLAYTLIVLLFYF